MTGRPEGLKTGSWLLLAMLLCLALAAPVLAFQSGPKAPQQGQPAVRSPPGPTPNQGLIYHGNTRSHRFHRPGCRYYNCRRCTAEFTSQQEAIAAGYIPCKVCRP